MTDLSEINSSQKQPKVRLRSIKFSECQNEDVKQLIFSTLKNQNRGQAEIYLLTTFFENFGQLKEFLKQFHSDESSILLGRLSMTMKYDFYPKDVIIFFYGDISDKMFIILKGSISVIVPKETKVKITEEEYLLYLVNLRNLKEYELIQKCLNINRGIFLKPDSNMETWLLSTKYKAFNKNKSILSDLSKEIIAAFLSNSNSKSSIENCNNVNVHSYIDKRKMNFSSDEDKVRKLVTIFEYNKVCSMKEGEWFGDRALNSIHRKRTATVISESECHFGVIDSESYNHSLKEAYEKEIKHRISFFLKDNHIFKKFDKDVFLKKYYSYFTFETIPKNEFIINEKKIPTNIFFLKNGEFELTCHKSINELNNMILRFNPKANFKHDKERCRSDTFFEVYMNKPHLIKLTILKENDIVGLDDMISFDNYEFNCHSISSISTVFRISKSSFESILIENERFKINMDNFLNMKNTFYAQRLIECKESLINKYQQIKNKSIKLTRSNFEFNQFFDKTQNFRNYNMTNKQKTMNTNDLKVDNEYVEIKSKNCDKNIYMKNLYSLKLFNKSGDIQKYNKTINNVSNTSKNSISQNYRKSRFNNKTSQEKNELDTSDFSIYSPKVGSDIKKIEGNFKTTTTSLDFDEKRTNYNSSNKSKITSNFFRLKEDSFLSFDSENQKKRNNHFQALLKKKILKNPFILSSQRDSVSLNTDNLLEKSIQRKELLFNSISLIAEKYYTNVNETKESNNFNRIKNETGINFWLNEKKNCKIPTNMFKILKLKKISLRSSSKTIGDMRNFKIDIFSNQNKFGN